MTTCSNPVRLICGDAAEFLRGLPASSIDCVVTSPPYFGLREYTNIDGEIGRENKPFLYLDALEKVFYEVYEVLKNTGSVWVNIGDTFRKGPMMIPWKFAMMMEDLGYEIVNVVIWYKPDSMAESTTRRFSQKYEPFFWFVKDFDKYYFNFDAAKIPVKVTSVERMGQKFYHTKGIELSRMRSMMGDMSHKIDDLLEGGVNAGDLWPLHTNKEKMEHAAPYPVHLCIRPIMATCPPDGKLYDPFCGSGTTAVAMLELGGSREFVGTDINPEAIAEANKRIAPYLLQTSLF